ncbi:type II CRISPR RNA-guided endonuclease Cas9 [Sphingobacterium detergens]|uniref:type II CRISPR RNA-guided endonuclease Cas9 n=1 Tax=Sphingobacterium detergens TaxID=1145106 RepID=UPI003AAD066F
MSKTILGLDLGTNSIGWALIKLDFEKKVGEILGMGTRIIPMSQDILGEFGKGNSISQTAERTGYRGVRRLRERFLLRRERLHRVLNLLGFLPPHYASQIDFTTKLGQFINHSEPQISYNSGFVFAESYDEMLNDFRDSFPEFLKDKNGQERSLPHAWTLYYLRKKAIRYKISKEELAWILLNFNQKRGYYQLRGEEEEDNPNKLVEFHSLRVVDVIADLQKNNKGEVWYSLVLENGWVYRRSSKSPLDEWKDKVKDFIVTRDINDDGSEKLDRDGEVKRSFRAPGPDDWTLLKKKTESEIDKSQCTVGEFIYDNLLRDPKQKIKGKLVRTIERKFYKTELIQILNKQAEFHSEFNDQDILVDCVRELYKHNEQHRKELSSKDLANLLVNDIIFYQRPLRSQKSGIGRCSLEYKVYKAKDKYGELLKDADDNFIEKRAYIQVIAKSNPYYQEFRLLQWIGNLEFYLKDNDEQVTALLIPDIETRQQLFDYLVERKDIKQEILIKFLLGKKGLKGRELTNESAKFRWNYVEDKTYPCYETRALVNSRLDKVTNVPIDFLTAEKEYALWHILYSVNDKIEFEKALTSFAEKNQLNRQEFVEAFKKFPPIKSDYGSFSERAIKKILPLMRFGSYWNWDTIDHDTKIRIAKVITGEYDDTIKERVREKAQHLVVEKDFQMLPLWLAQYIVYDRHAEVKDLTKWTSVDDLAQFLNDFKQHSLRNPIVEQIVTETLRVVKDIWNKYGTGRQDYFSEIHIELGREMKNPADERKRMTNIVTENENTNSRIKSLLAELASDHGVENVRPYSPMQQEILKIYEEGALNSGVDVDDDILKISKTAQPSSSDLKRYKLWLEQKYCSPYTGQPIPLNKLFTPDYEIEHIIPQSLYFDDSMSNKVICEAAVNKLKDNRIGLSFIKTHHGQVVDCGFGRRVKIFEVEDYEKFIQTCYSKNRGKRNKLLLEDIPEKMIERQLNDTRYISKYVTGLLSNIVRDNSITGNDDGINSKNVLPGNGKVTSILKQDWGLNDVWNDLILPRFERMNAITNSTSFTTWNDNHQKFLPTVPIELSKGFSKKRIDHRHHAMDALVIACATRDHINLLNNESARSTTKRHDLSRKLRHYEKVVYTDPKTGQRISREVPKDFIKPWDKFTVEAHVRLLSIIISFKQNNRVINKATNYYESYYDEDGNLRLDKNGKPVKGINAQKGINWAIRKSLHKETVSGKVNLPRVKLAKGKILTATRKTLDPSFDAKSILLITDTGIQKILINYLNAKNNKPEIAFSPEGIEEMNQNISLYNDGKNHQPIKKVRVFEQGSKFALGEIGVKSTKYVEAAKGTNLFFGIYVDDNGKRSYDTIPLNIVIERQKQGLTSVPETNEKGHRLLFSLSPNDSVTIYTSENVRSENICSAEQIYKLVSFSGAQAFFIKQTVSASIVNKGEFSTLNKMERSIEGLMIKDVCEKACLDRLGNILKIER